MPGSSSRQERRAAARRGQKSGAATARAKGDGRAAGPRRRSISIKAPRTAVWLVAAVVVVVVAAVAVVTLSLGSSADEGALPVGYPNGNAFNTRDVGGPIDSANVSKLAVAWKLPIIGKGEYGDYAASPVVVRGVVFSQDLGSNVQAISLATGRVLWTKRVEALDHGPNGVSVGGGRVYGATPSSAFALDEMTGKLLWSLPLIAAGGGHAQIDMAPGYHDGIVYVSTVPGDDHEPFSADAVGVLWALSARTGHALWHFDTVPESLWSSTHGKVNSGGGLWYTPAFDEQGNLYAGIANPEPDPGTLEFPWGSSRPGPDLYTDSIVKLNARTGKLEWYYQLTPHDLYDWDLQDPPMLTRIGGRQVVIDAGKAGIVIALDADTGKLLWKRAVGIHNGHDNDSLYAMKGEYSKLKLPETVYPGRIGGVIAPMATNGATVFVPVVNVAQTITPTLEVQEPGPDGGELVALDVATGAVKWKRSLPEPVFGSATVVNNVVLTTMFGGNLLAFETETGRVLSQTQLPAGTNAGVTVSGDTVIAPAAFTSGKQKAQIVAYRLPAAGRGKQTTSKHAP
jgi:outer membrane protein assembly factor BamB